MERDGKKLLAIRRYLDKQNYSVFSSSATVHPTLGIAVCIPCYNEPDIRETLQSLFEATQPSCAVEILVVVNDGVFDSQEFVDANRKTLDELQQWAVHYNTPTRKLLFDYRGGLSKKNAGAGFARKVAMDAAALRFLEAGNSNGIIVSLDADTRVSGNYFVEIEHYFVQNPKTRAATVYFEHPVDGSRFGHKLYQAIRLYELYLRYYKNLLEYYHFPHAIYTVGSAFCCTVSAYVSVGGMNRKQAGEDFYFLHKLVPEGNFGEIVSCAVYPSSRPSQRVPFGTGPEVARIARMSNPDLHVYNPNSLRGLSELFDRLEDLYRINSVDEVLRLLSLPDYLRNFLCEERIEAHVEEIRSNVSNFPAFRKRFFKWFNAFFVLKYLNRVHEHQFEKIPVSEASVTLLGLMNIQPISKDVVGLLQTFRTLDRGGKL